MDWLQGLKVGDEVEIRNRAYSEIYEITRASAKRLWVHSICFDRGTGVEVVAGDFAHYLGPVTTETQQRVERCDLAAAINDVEFYEYSLDQLRRIKVILDE